MKKNIYIVKTETEIDRLDTFLSLQSSFTRSHIQRLIKLGMVTVNGIIEKIRYKVKINDRIEISIPDKPLELLIPENIPIDIIEEDDHIVVVNKPPHMVVYPAIGNRHGTLMNALAYSCDTLSPVGAPLRPGVVHRLDKDTSGLMVVAKNNRAHYDLVDQFREREIEKYYLALIYGNLKDEKGEIKKLIGRSTSDRKRMTTKSRSGKEAITQFEVIERFRQTSLVKAKILTGRTHQIRVHFASIGNPVLGDKTYGKKTLLTSGRQTINFPRQMLHAHSLKLKHPASKEIVQFEAPMPEDMEKSIDEIKLLGF
jgi:23S rRNA pseudouridine1911/1915/1917 synthase